MNEEEMRIKNIEEMQKIRSEIEALRSDIDAMTEAIKSIRTALTTHHELIILLGKRVLNE